MRRVLRSKSSPILLTLRRKVALALLTRAVREAIPSMPSDFPTRRNLFRAVVTDLHCWMPLSVLIGVPVLGPPSLVRVLNRRRKFDSCPTRQLDGCWEQAIPCFDRVAGEFQCGWESLTMSSLGRGDCPVMRDDHRWFSSLLTRNQGRDHLLISLVLLHSGDIAFLLISFAALLLIPPGQADFPTNELTCQLSNKMCLSCLRPRMA